jgi:HD-GYP domain-containing protein (c-di-GMP phosphodiesterase class II)
MMREQNAERSTHLSRVARLARAVCHQLALQAEQVDEVVRAAELHDIGMIAIPQTLLEKRGPLTEDERAFVERHPVIGERVLGAAPSLAPIARIVRGTHERWDGHGYPDGLAGEAIPIGSRIIFACNAYDAITSERPYRERRWPADALAELWAGSGTQFDPAVVAALQAAVRGGADVATPEYVLRVGSAAA